MGIIGKYYPKNVGDSHSGLKSEKKVQFIKVALFAPKAKLTVFESFSNNSEGAHE